jgi:hypothetical protein
VIASPRLDEAGEERMWIKRFRLQLRVELHPYEPRMVRSLDDLRQQRPGRSAGTSLQSRDVRVMFQTGAI